MKTAIVAVVAVAFVASCTAEAKAPPVKVVTVTESASPAPTSSVDEILGETGSDVVTVNSGDARACELVELAATREANSPSWISIMSDAGYKARDYDLQDAIDKAYWTSSNPLATQRTRAIVAYCRELV